MKNGKPTQGRWKIPTKVMIAQRLAHKALVAGETTEAHRQAATDRTAEILAERLRHALRWPFNEDAVLLDRKAAAVLLLRTEASLTAEEVQHDDDT